MSDHYRSAAIQYFSARQNLRNSISDFGARSISEKFAVAADAMEQAFIGLGRWDPKDSNSLHALAYTATESVNKADAAVQLAPGCSEDAP